ncbi:MAG: type II toxin-antitoxin system RelE/ParE family toxin [Anaerovoracaceae bacterium]
MDYNVIMTERAKEQLDAITHYILYQFKSRQAAENVLNDVEKTINKLEYAAGSLPICQDIYLAGKGYHKIPLEKHNYVMLYRIEDEKDVIISGIFHMMEEYQTKL